MTPILVLIGVLGGLAVGSFVNVVAIRVPAGKSVTHPGSACPNCHAPIAPRDNIPVLSWILLRGRCRHCRERISVRYPIVEAVTAFLFVAAVFVIGSRFVLPGYWWFAAVTMALILTDLDHKLIPNKILFPGTLVGGALLLVGSALDGDIHRFGWALAGGAAYFVGLLILALVARGGFGYGDVKLAFLLGMFTAYENMGFVLVAAFLAFISGGLISIFLLATRIRGRKDAIPFGPYLVIGAYMALGFGQAIIDWYLR